jgi:hypothetical protein
VAQGAIQGARYAARLIAARAKAGDATLPAAQPFAYVDKGSMATISKFRAVVSVGTLRLSGFVAWVMWLVLHLFYIAGFKQRVSTLLQWAIAFSACPQPAGLHHQQLVAGSPSSDSGSMSRLLRVSTTPAGRAARDRLVSAGPGVAAGVSGWWLVLRPPVPRAHGRG